MGLEPTPDAYVASMVSVFAEVWRALADDGVCWLNLGDSYAGSFGAQSRDNPDAAPLSAKQGSGRNPAVWGTGRPVNARVEGLKSKDLCGIPWRVAFALQAAGWYLRSDIIWSKPNPMPESVTDRPTKAHEYLFLLTKSAKYFYNQDAIREQPTGRTDPITSFGKTVKRGDRYELDAMKGANARSVWTIPEEYTGQATKDYDAAGAQNPSDTKRRILAAMADPDYLGANRRSVWTIPTSPYPDAHFATFPEALVEPCILAGTSEKGQCPACGKAWERVTEREPVAQCGVTPKQAKYREQGLASSKSTIGRTKAWGANEGRTQIIGWQPGCDCNAGDPVPQTVLDPFCGSGTTGAVAIRLQRNFVGIELNESYVQLARKRIGSVAPLLAQEIA